MGDLGTYHARRTENTHNVDRTCGQRQTMEGGGLNPATRGIHRKPMRKNWVPPLPITNLKIHSGSK